jgi:hypothetical protein
MQAALAWGSEPLTLNFTESGWSIFTAGLQGTGWSTPSGVQKGLLVAERASAPEVSHADLRAAKAGGGKSQKSRFLGG